MILCGDPMAEGFCTLQESFERFARLVAESQDLSHDRRAQGGRGFWEALQKSLLNGIIIIFVAFEFVIPPSTCCQFEALPRFGT
jgi:hypothetical protein